MKKLLSLLIIIIIVNTSLISYLDFYKPFQSERTVQIFPNPAADYIRIKSSKITKIKNIEILDILGNTSFKISTHNLYNEINISSLKIGRYFVKIKFIDNSEEINLLIKQQ